MNYSYDRVWAEVEINNIRHNLDAIYSCINPKGKIIGVIKADGYGHGALPVAKELEKLDYVFGYGVATAEEALMLRANSIRKPIIIIGYSFPNSYEEMLVRDVRITVFRKDMIDELDRIAKRLGLIAKVHVKVDTGMSRIGIFPDDEGLEFVRYALSKENILVEGIFTHFAKADETDLTHAYGQLDKYSKFVEKCETVLEYKFPIKHCSNSAGIIEMKEANFDAVRAGIIMYGMWPSDEVSHEKIDIKPLLSLKSRITYIKKVPAGTSISYGGTYTTTRETVIATIPVGYADGYPRSLSGKGFVLVGGKKAPILGRICMDQFMCDVTDIDAKEGMVVTLIGREGDEVITMEDIQHQSTQLNYELACIIGKRVPRIYTVNGEPQYTRDYFVDAPIREV